MSEMPTTGLRPPSRAPWIILALVALVIAALGVHWYLQQQAAPPAAAPAARPDAGTPEAEPSGPAPAVEPTRLRFLLGSLSSNALLRRCLGGEDLVRRVAIVTDNLREGVTPRKQLDCTAPAGPFSVVARGRRRFIAPASYSRYDGFADAVASVDVQVLAKVYDELRPALRAAYRALGYPGTSPDAAAARALQRILAAPVLDGEVELVEAKGALFAFADTRLERLGDVEKHLLRMGPRNTRRLQAKAREIQQALDLPTGSDVGGPGR